MTRGLKSKELEWVKGMACTKAQRQARESGVFRNYKSGYKQSLCKAVAVTWLEEIGKSQPSLHTLPKRHGRATGGF